MFIHHRLINQAVMTLDSCSLCCVLVSVLVLCCLVFDFRVFVSCLVVSYVLIFHASFKCLLWSSLSPSVCQCSHPCLALVISPAHLHVSACSCLSPIFPCYVFLDLEFCLLNWFWFVLCLFLLYVVLPFLLLLSLAFLYCYFATATSCPFLSFCSWPLVFVFRFC